MGEPRELEAKSTTAPSDLEVDDLEESGIVESLTRSVVDSALQLISRDDFTDAKVKTIEMKIVVEATPKDETHG